MRNNYLEQYKQWITSKLLKGDKKVARSIRENLSNMNRDMKAMYGKQFDEVTVRDIKQACIEMEGDN